jgi:hypothetical protein
MSGSAGRRLAAVAVLLAAAAAEAAPSTFAPRDVVRRFYEWVLPNGERVRGLEPKVSWAPDTRQLSLDTGTLPEFVAAFMDSGLFAPEFAEVLSGYYRNHAAAIASTPPDLRDAYATHGRDILLETEDMDIFFCAQEAQYNRQFIRRMKLRTLRADSTLAVVRSTSPYGWMTEFALRRVADHWLITSYCVFR